MWKECRIQAIKYFDVRDSKGMPESLAPIKTEFVEREGGVDRL